MASATSASGRVPFAAGLCSPTANSANRGTGIRLANLSAFRRTISRILHRGFGHRRTCPSTVPLRRGLHPTLPLLQGPSTPEHRRGRALKRYCTRPSSDQSRDRTRSLLGIVASRPHVSVFPASTGIRIRPRVRARGIALSLECRWAGGPGSSQACRGTAEPRRERQLGAASREGMQHEAAFDAPARRWRLLGDRVRSPMRVSATECTRAGQHKGWRSSCTDSPPACAPASSAAPWRRS